MQRKEEEARKKKERELREKEELTKKVQKMSLWTTVNEVEEGLAKLHSDLLNKGVLL